MNGRGLNGGRGYTVHGYRRGRVQGRNYYGANSASKKVICVELGNNQFYYGHKVAADQMRIPWEKLVQHIGINYIQ